MAVAHDSASYPILGAARTAGVDYALALEWAWSKDAWTATRVESRIIALHGQVACLRFIAMMGDAWRSGRVRVRKLGGFA